MVEIQSIIDEAMVPSLQPSFRGKMGSFFSSPSVLNSGSQPVQAHGDDSVYNSKGLSLSVKHEAEGDTASLVASNGHAERAVRATAKRKRDEEAVVVKKRPKRKGSRGSRRRSDAAADMSEMFDEIDLKLECGLCHQHFNSHAKQICHNPCFYKRKGMAKQPVQWTCPQCHKFFNRINILQQHMTTHFEGNFCCKKCDVRMSRRSLMIDHIKNKHLP